MNRVTVTSLATVLVCWAVPALAQQEHARYDFPFVVEGQEHVLTYEGTHDVMKQTDPAIKLVVFVHHGGSQNPVTYFNSMKAALQAAAADHPDWDLLRTTMIISPGMIGDQHIADNPKRYQGNRYAYWPGGWREGVPSVNKPQVSNFDLLDGLVLHVANRFPNVKAIIHAGHSAGGQLVSRYSFGSPVYDVLRGRGIFVRYIISNPSSVLYFDRQRPDLITGKGFIDYRSRIPVLATGECREFNTYKYGLDEMVPYMTRRPVAAMLASFRQREIYLLQGEADTDPMADGLDRDCPGMLQGRFRLERGQRYYEYLGHFFGPEIYQTKFLALTPGVGHSAAEMFKSKAGKPIIFIDADNAAAAMRQREQQKPASKFTLVIHGGGGVRDRAEFAAKPELAKAYRDGLAASLGAGYQVLAAGGSAVEAVEAAISVMEDDPHFNAGKGASYTSDGTVELDASIMDGRTMKAGGIAAARHIKNPISMARIVLEKTPHVLVAGEGVTALAQEMGVPWVPESYFYTEEKWNELNERMNLKVPFGTPFPRGTTPKENPPQEDPENVKLWGTVGAVALDAQGNLAAGTSTGGRISKRPGRVGDSPIIGASTYANNNIVAVSTTGLGEKHMVLLTSKEIASLMAYKGMSVRDAAEYALKTELVGLGGSGGAIALDTHGNFATPYTDTGMYRGWVREDGVVEVRIYER
jgi:beta-aspartyl-peptidase (threonine type)